LIDEPGFMQGLMARFLDFVIGVFASRRGRFARFDIQNASAHRRDLPDRSGHNNNLGTPLLEAIFV